MSMIVLSFLPHFHQMSFALIVFFGVMLLIILVDDFKSINKYLKQIEWATLLFFAALFVLMKCLAELGLATFMGDHFKELIVISANKMGLTMAVIITLWVNI